jgi:hypothetical protein
MPQALPVIQGIGTVAGTVGAVKSLTGGGGSAAGQTTTTQQVDPQTQAMQQDLYRRSQQIAQQPFIPYTGPMVAGFSPDQLRQFQATRGIFESGMGFDPTKALQGMVQDQYTPTIQPVTGFEAPTIEATMAPGAAQIQETPTFGGAQIGSVAGPTAAQIGPVAGPTAATIEKSPLFGGAQIESVVGPTAAQIGQVSTPQFQGLLSADIGAYQSPYQQQVIETAMQDIQRQADIARGGAQERAIRAGAFGGSRSAILEAESQRPYVEQMAKTAAGLRQAGFEQAQRAAQADIARQQELGIFGAGQAQQRALQQAQLQQQAGLTGFEAQQQRALQQAQLQQQAGLAGQDVEARRALQQAQLQQQAGLTGTELEQQRALQQAQLQQQAGLMGTEQAQQRALQQAQFGQQAGLAAQDVAARRALEQARLGQQAGIFGAELGQQRRMQQAQLEQQRQLAGLDIAGRAALTQPQLEMQARAQRAGLLGGLQASQLQGLGLLGGIGAQQQALQQRAIDAQRGEFARALAYPGQQLGLLATGVSGVQPTITRTGGYDPSGLEKFQAGLNLFNTVQPIFGNLFSPSQQQLPQVNLPSTLPGTGGYPIG